MKVVLSRQRDCFGAGGLVGLVVVEEVQEGGLGGQGVGGVEKVAGWDRRNQNQSLLVAFEVGRWWRVG